MGVEVFGDPHMRQHFRSLLLSIKTHLEKKATHSRPNVDKAEFRGYSHAYREGRLYKMHPHISEAFQVALEQLPMYPGEHVLAALERVEAGILREEQMERLYSLRFVNIALWVLREKRNQEKRAHQHLVQLKSRNVISMELYRAAARKN